MLNQTMSKAKESHTERARQAADEAAAARLDEVREHGERAQKVWSGLAEQSRKVRTIRDKAIAAKTIADGGAATPE